MGQGAARVGDRLQVLRKGEELIDPETGISLGSEDAVIGSATVSQVQEKFSIASLEGSTPQVERGDKVVSLEAPPTIEYAANWEPPAAPKKKRRGLFRRNKDK